MAAFFSLQQRLEAADLTTVEAGRVASALVVAGVAFEFIPAHLTARQGHSITVRAKHGDTLKTAVAHASVHPINGAKIPTVGKGDQA